MADEREGNGTTASPPQNALWGVCLEFPGAAEFRERALAGAVERSEPAADASILRIRRAWTSCSMKCLTRLLHAAP